ncbi:hypothetical protein ABZV60_25360 [Streptomyces sp. NPDC004787]|uniref:hypothetical protein n=1 Tax=Streptomyces sp. NPDC004787 TaxID=3154291 RepID=UPI0033A61AAA
MAGNLFIPIDFGLNGPGNDNGNRPWQGPQAFYDNSSIWLDPRTNVAHVGEATHVKVRVSNRGTQKMQAVTVQAWSFVPGIGNMSPSSAIQTFESGIGDIPAGGSLVFTCDASPVWHPSTAELAKTTNGHMCIIANCFQSDEFVPDPEGGPVPNPVPVNPEGDQHQGQRNIQIVQVQQAAASEPQHVHYSTYTPPASPTPHTGPYLVSATHNLRDLDPAAILALRGHEGFAVDPDSGIVNGGGLNLITSEGLRRILPSTEPPAFELRVPNLPGLDEMFHFAEDRPAMIDSEMVVQLPRDAEVGSLHSFDISLKDDKGYLVGSGLTVMMLVTE